MKKHKLIWNYFKLISSIPRQSGHESKIANFLFNTFKHLKAEVYKDKFNNVVARIPATFGLEKLPMLTLQAHSDMVAVKTTNSKHNFNKDPIQLIFQKDKVTAKNTSLGADNGIGIALILALFNDPNIKHGPLEAVITSKEEIGLIGAKQLNPKLVKGKYLINLDSETDSKIIVGCVGSSTINSYVSLKWIKPKFKNSFNLTIANLLGGHSGVDIDKKHLNAIKSLFYVIKEIQRIHPILINDISGGDVLNTIPSSSNIVFNTNASFSEIQKIIRNACLKLLQTHPLEKHLKFTLNKTKTNKCVNERQTILIINFFNQVFNGVKIFNKKYQLPQASSNLGKTYIKNNQLYIGVNIRDINKESKLQTNQLILDKLKTLNAKYKIHGGPGWNPTLQISNLAKMFQNHVRKHYKKTLHFSFAVGGIEPKDLLRRIPSLKEGIAYGVNIFFAHSTNECVSISSTNHVYDILSSLYLMIEKLSR